jgi:hypothetical protein
MPDVMLRLFQASWNGLPVASLAIFAIGGFMYLVMSMSTRSSPSSSRSMAVRRPGWIARRRARGGIRHRHDRVGVGYSIAVGAVHGRQHGRQHVSGEGARVSGGCSPPDWCVGKETGDSERATSKAGTGRPTTVNVGAPGGSTIARSACVPSSRSVVSSVEARRVPVPIGCADSPSLRVPVHAMAGCVISFTKNR